MSKNGWTHDIIAEVALSVIQQREIYFAFFTLVSEMHWLQNIYKTIIEKKKEALLKSA